MLKNFFLKHIKEFIPISQLANYSNNTKIYIEEDDITRSILLINLDPVVFGIYSPDKKYSEKSLITYQIGNTTIAKVLINLKETKGALLIFEAIETKLLEISYYERYIELPQLLYQSKKSKFKFTEKSIMHLISWYLFPRKIYLVVVCGVGFFNIFPMDLHMKCSDSDNYFFALQPSNLSENILKENKKIIVCELASKDISRAYDLGKNHGRVNLFNTQLPFNCIQSENFKFDIPEFCIGYKEIEITDFKLMNTHTLFQGKIVFSKSEPLQQQQQQQPFHIHRFYYRQYLKLNKIRLKKL